MQATYLPLDPGPAPELTVRDYLAILKRFWLTFLTVFLLVAAAGIVMTLRMPSVYRTQATLSVPTRSAFSGADSGPLAPFLAAAQPDSVDTQLRVLESDSLVSQAARDAQVISRPGVPPPSVIANLLDDPNDSASSRGDSQLIQVMVEGGDPQAITRLANAIGQRFLARQDLATRSGLRSALDLLHKEQERAGAGLAATERKRILFQQAHGGSSPATEREIRAADYSAVMARVLESRSSVAATQAQIASLQIRLEKEPVELLQSMTKENPRVAKLRDKLDDLRFQRADLLRDYLPTSRRVKDLDSEIASVSGELAAEPVELETRLHLPNPARATLQSQLDALQTALPGQEENYRSAAAELAVKRQLLHSLGSWEAQADQLDRDRDAAQATYTMLTDRLRDLEIRSRAQLPTARVIDAAEVPRVPIRPRRPLQIVLAFGLALMLAAGAVLLQNMANGERISSPDEMGQILALPTLGSVPPIAAHLPRLVHALPINSPVAEAYRALRTTIGFAAAEHPLRRLQIASPSEQEGRSTTVINLATAMARDGKMVIMVDADLRTPSLHRLLNSAGSPGLTEVLSGTQSLDDVLQPTAVHDLMLLPAGAPAAHPTELLGSHAFEQLLEQLDARADLVIVDTPPCLPVADAAIVAARMDGVILVVQSGVTRKEAVRQAAALISQTRTRLLGTLLTQARGAPGGGYYYAPGYPLPIPGRNGAYRPHGAGTNGKGPDSHREEQEAVGAPAGREKEHE